MAPSADAFGQQLWDIYKDGYPYQIIERSDGLIGVGPGGTRSTYSSKASMCSASTSRRSPSSSAAREIDEGAGYAVVLWKSRNKKQ